MRQVVLDTETTGLEPQLGHRIIEIGAVEMIERRPTGRHFHVYINPEREVEQGAMEVHGISNDFLADKPRFAEVADDFLAFVRDSELLIHNAPFDVGFLDSELARLDTPVQVEDVARITDTLVMARDLHPGQHNSLDALCRRYDVDNSNRTLHGALLDAEILAEVFLAMTGGQTDLGLELGRLSDDGSGPRKEDMNLAALRVIQPDASEEEAHRDRLASMRRRTGQCLWPE